MLDREILKSALAATPECLNAQQLEKLTAEQVRGHAHVAKCPRCQAEIAMLHAFEGGAPVSGGGAAVAWISAQLERRLDQIKNPSRAVVSRGAVLEKEQASSWWGWLHEIWSIRILVPVAAVLAVAVTSIVLLRPGKEPDLRADSGTGTEVFRSQQVTLVAPSGELATAPVTLEWKPFPGAAKYKVALTEVDHAPLWSSETTQVSAAVPASARSKMLPGKTVLWEVTALDAQGKILAISPAERMVVSRKRSETSHY